MVILRYDRGALFHKVARGCVVFGGASRSAGESRSAGSRVRRCAALRNDGGTRYGNSVSTAVRYGHIHNNLRTST